MPDVPAVPAPAADPAAAEEKLAATFKSYLEKALPGHLERAVASHLAKSTPAAPAAQAAPIADPEVGKRIEGLEASLKAEKDARAAERRAARDEKVFHDLRGELTGKLRDGAVDTVARLLRADGKLKVAADGTATLKIGDDELPLRDGVAAYLKTPEAGFFIPAPGTKAPAAKPGARPQLPPLPAGHRLTPAERLARTRAALET